MGWYPGARVARVEADELRAHRILGYCRHDAEIALALLDRQHIAHRLENSPEREPGKGLLHRCDQLIPAQQAADIILAQIHDHRSHPGDTVERMIDAGWPGGSRWANNRGDAQCPG